MTDTPEYEADFEIDLGQLESSADDVELNLDFAEGLDTPTDDDILLPGLAEEVEPEPEPEPEPEASPTKATDPTDPTDTAREGGEQA